MIFLIKYDLEKNLSSDEFISILKSSNLSKRRPIDNHEIINKMLTNADIILTARKDDRLVGISRAITDRSFCTYLSDLCVDKNYQGKGIGKELIKRTHEAAGLETILILLSAPEATAYYPHIGMEKHDSCWIIPRKKS